MSENLLYDLGEAGRAWTRKSLGSGLELSRRILASVDLAHGTTYLAGLASGSAPVLAGHPLDHGINDPSVISLTRSGESLFEILSAPGFTGPPIIVVEDDLRRPGDPSLRQEHAGSIYYLDQVPLHVSSLGGLKSPAALIRFLQSSASGYPLNAFVLPRGQVEDIQAGRTAENASEMGRSVVAIINAALDGEAYSLWLPHRRSTPASL